MSKSRTLPESFPAFAFATFTGMLIKPAETLRGLKDVPRKRIAGYYAAFLLVALILMGAVLLTFLGLIPSGYPVGQKIAGDLQVTVLSTGLWALLVLAGTLLAVLVFAGMSYLLGARSGLAPVTKAVLLSEAPLGLGMVGTVAVAGLTRNNLLSLLVVIIACLWSLYLLYLGLRELLPLPGRRAMAAVLVPVIILLVGIFVLGVMSDISAQDQHNALHRYVSVQKTGTRITITTEQNPGSDSPALLSVSVNGAFVNTTISPVPGSQVTVNGTTKKDQVVVTAEFPDGRLMVVHDSVV